VIEKNRPLAHQLLSLHKIVGFSLLGLIVLHVSAALYHHFWRRDDTLTAMLPAAAAWRTLEPLVGQARDPDAALSRGVGAGTPNSAHSSH
jgi:hypothetical protein